ncbi:MAG: ABC transporter permease subunit [Promethearchaeota archaeon]|jgi:ABC-type dipeptide/oligopeptide/nickel transport system permease component
MRKIKEIYINLIFTTVIAIIIFFIGFEISFLFWKLMPGDPVAAWLAAAGVHNPSQAQYDQAAHILGFDLPISLQFFKYVGEHLTGNWGISVSIVSQQPVSLLVFRRFPATIQATILPMIIGISLGIILGIISSRYRNKWEDTAVQSFCFLIIALPVFFLGMIYQFLYGYIWDIFTPTGISFLPMFVLSLTITALITLQTRTYLMNTPDERSIISITSLVARTFGFLFMLYILVEQIFNLHGFGELLIEALFLYDFFVLINLLFMLGIIFIVTIVVSNLLFIFYRYLASKGYTERITRYCKPKTETESEEVRNEKNIKEYLLNRATSPIFIVGIILVLSYIFLAIVPQVMTQYSFDEANALLAGSWNPPSPDHPLGQTALGRDVLARTMYGIRDSIILGVGAIIIGLIGGVNLGFVAGKFRRWGYKPIMALMILFYIFPSFLFVILLLSIFGPNYVITLLTIGFLLIPLFTRATANAMTGEFNRKTIGKIGKSLISYIPLAIVLAIILYNVIGYLGFADNRLIQLGRDISVARQNPYDAPWAWFWPGLAIFLISLSFIIFHLGLKGYASIRKIRRKSLETGFKAE